MTSMTLDRRPLARIPETKIVKSLRVEPSDWQDVVDEAKAASLLPMVFARIALLIGTTMLRAARLVEEDSRNTGRPAPAWTVIRLDRRSA